MKVRMFVIARDFEGLLSVVLETVRFVIPGSSVRGGIAYVDKDGVAIIQVLALCSELDRTIWEVERELQERLPKCVVEFAEAPHDASLFGIGPSDLFQGGGGSSGAGAARKR